MIVDPRATSGACPVLVNIISVSYSGSTWLNLLLGNHSIGLSIGELNAIHRIGRAVCKLHGESCPFWSRFADEPVDALLGKVAQTTGQSLLVINNPRDFQSELDAAGYRQKFIHLLRDGRAVAASTMRKHPGHTVVRATRHWARSLRKNRKRLRSRQPADVIEVRYEDILADTPGQLQRLCSFLEVAYEPGMLEYWTTERCFLGGSPGTIYALGKMCGVEADGVNTEKVDQDFYDKSDPGCFADERWRTELSPGQLRIFSLLGGRLNRSLGYAKT